MGACRLSFDTPANSDKPENYRFNASIASTTFGARATDNARLSASAEREAALRIGASETAPESHGHADKAKSENIALNAVHDDGAASAFPTFGRALVVKGRGFARRARRTRFDGVRAGRDGGRTGRKERELNLARRGGRVVVEGRRHAAGAGKVEVARRQFGKINGRRVAVETRSRRDLPDKPLAHNRHRCGRSRRIGRRVRRWVCCRSGCGIGRRIRCRVSCRIGCRGGRRVGRRRSGRIGLRFEGREAVTAAATDNRQRKHGTDEREGKREARGNDVFH